MNLQHEVVKRIRARENILKLFESNNKALKEFMKELDQYLCINVLIYPSGDIAAKIGECYEVYASLDGDGFGLIDITEDEPIRFVKDLETFKEMLLDYFEDLL